MSTKTKKLPKPPKPTPVLPTGCEALLSKAQICHATQVSLRTFAGWLSSGSFPPPDARIGKFARWRVETFNRWLRKQCGTAEDT